MGLGLGLAVVRDGLGMDWVGDGRGGEREVNELPYADGGGSLVLGHNVCATSGCATRQAASQ